MVRTRFAPSPTGYLHIGGVRTALFNWLFARQHGGQFILRIDDTDQQRNVAEALQPILDGFRWLGLDWDEGPEKGGPHGPYYQSQKLDRYQSVVRELVDKGAAYWDYATKEELDAERKAAETEKRPYLYSRDWMADTAAKKARFEADGRPGVVRLKMHRNGACQFRDHIRGDMEVEWRTEQDSVIQRADGTVLYNLANVVDDFDMKITHVIRAEEHLSNTPRQLFMIDALGWPRPEYAHLPFVAEPGSKNKLSKRKIPQYLKNPDFKKVYDHGKAIADRLGLATSDETFSPVLVEFYEKVGYLPDAIVNYLLLLGWAHEDGKTEFFTRDEMVKVFSLGRVNKGAASFDAKKLMAFQERYMREVPLPRKVDLALPFLVKAGLVPDPVPADLRERVERIIKESGPRLIVAGDVLDYDYFFLDDDRLNYDLGAVKKRLQKPGAIELLSEFCERIATLRTFDAGRLRTTLYNTLSKSLRVIGEVNEQFVYQQMDMLQRETAIIESTSFDAVRLEVDEMPRFLEAQRIQIGDIIHALRVAITGNAVGFGLYETMELLGPQRCAARIRLAIKKFGQANAANQLGLFPNTPDALPHALTAPEVNKEVELYSGLIRVETAGAIVEGLGTLEMGWRPKPSVTFRLAPSTKVGLDIQPSPSRVFIPDWGASAEALVLGIEHGSDGNTTVRGVPNSRLITAVPQEIAQAQFYLTNFHDSIGGGIRDLPRRQAWAGRSTAVVDGWSITIDGVPKVRDRLQLVRKEGGCAITHAGWVARTDGSAFTVDQLDELLYSLQTYLSFARGFWVAPILVTGFDSLQREVWMDWTLRMFDAWRSVESWYPMHDRNTFAQSFSSFHALWQQPAGRELLRTAIYWYILGNEQGSVDRGLVSAFIAFEYLVRSVSVQNAIVDIDSGDGTAYSTQLAEQLLHAIGVDTTVPDDMDRLYHLSQASAASAPALLSQIRNYIIHPCAIRSGSTLDTGIPGSIWQAWYVCLWYVELLLLRAIGYGGLYSKRIGNNRWVGQAELVPWAKSSTTDRQVVKPVQPDPAA